MDPQPLNCDVALTSKEQPPGLGTCTLAGLLVERAPRAVAFAVMAGDAKGCGTNQIDLDRYPIVFSFALDDGFLSLCRSLNNPWMNGVLEGEQYAQAG